MKDNKNNKINNNTPSSALIKEVKKDLSIQEKRDYIIKERIEIEFQELIDRKEEELDLKLLEDVKLDNQTIKRLIKDSEEYIKRAKKCEVFINNEFKGKVPFFARNLILVLAKTGSGKSTATANIAYPLVMKKKKILILTNEEHPSDVYNRITALILGFGYYNHEKLTDKQVKYLSKGIKFLSKFVTVVGDDYQSRGGRTTTLEGIKSVFDSLLINKIHYDCVILDYYQNVSRSIRNPKLTDWQVQGLLANYLDKFKNEYTAPIVVMAQKADDVADGASYKQLIEGRKVIANKSTCILEMVPDRENFRTIWNIKKNRFTNTLGESIVTGFWQGQFVEYTEEFRQNIREMKNNIKLKQILSDENDKENNMIDEHMGDNDVD